MREAPASLHLAGASFYAPRWSVVIAERHVVGVVVIAELDRRVMEIVDGDRKLAADRFQALVDLIAQAARAIATGRT